MNIGRTIKELRKKRQQTQQELAFRCNITQTYLSQIESNKKEPNLSTLKIIGENLEVPLAFIFLMAMESDDLDPQKKQAFDTISASLKDLVNESISI